jgi:hypothetical protein
MIYKANMHISLTKIYKHKNSLINYININIDVT